MLGAALWAGSGAASFGDAAPVLFSEPTHESPVRADPDDLILLPGYGLSAADVVVYQALRSTTAPAAPPQSVPTGSMDAALGIADVVSAADAPYAIAVHLPSTMTKHQSYALWIWDGSAWSNGVKINDARPLWITPDSAFQTMQLAHLPRVLKVVGRNLDPAPAIAATQVRLAGPVVYTLPAVADSAAATGAVDPVATPQIARYVAKVALPAQMAVGTYTVEVSRDGGASWVALLGNNGAAPQTFAVLSDPVAPPNYDLARYGCHPNSGDNALGCIAAAIADAAKAGGGTVRFAPGVWNLDLPHPGPLTGCEAYLPGAPNLAVTCEGIVVPANVNLQGSVEVTAAVPATLSRGPLWARAGLPTFSLQGNNTVSDLVFADQVDYTPWETPKYNNDLRPGAVFQLGAQFFRVPGGMGPGTQGAYHLNVFNPPNAISHVVITRNIFDKPYLAITDGSLPVDHLVVTDNVFGGAFDTAIYVGENGYDIWLPFRFTDAIIAFNRFYPSSNYQYSKGVYGGVTVPANTSGPIATQLNTALREDFSNNLADGRSTQYFYDQHIAPKNPQGALENPKGWVENPKGWRAAFFWSTGKSQEMTLVSQNRIFCSGDKAGDGEAIAYDGNVFLGGMLDPAGHAAAALRVIGSAAWIDPATGNRGSTVTVQGRLVDPVPVDQQPSIPAARFYPGQWLRLLQGPGLGQWRKIISLSTGANDRGPTLALNVSPAFDVLPPVAGLHNSVASIGAVYWQNATVDNDIEQGVAAGCTKFNQDYKLTGDGVTQPLPSGGVITWFDSVGDSSVEGNQQSETSGIVLYDFSSPANREVAGAYVIAKTSDEVRNNVINDEYEWTSARSAGGIQMTSGARDHPIETDASNPPDPPVTGFGITIAGNRIVRADASNFDRTVPTPLGAIGVTPGINENGPVDATGQTSWKITDSTLIFHNTLSEITGGGIARAALGIAALSPAVPQVWRSVLYANSCSDTTTPLIDNGIGTARYCPAATAPSCECEGASPVDVGVTAVASSVAVPVGSAVTYVATVTNHSTTAAANGVTLAVEPPPGLEITGLSVGSGGASCDLSIDLCSLGALQSTRSVTATITAVGAVAGHWEINFSVTHRDPDPAVANDGVLVDTLVTR